jgi:hypothetical protein
MVLRTFFDPARGLIYEGPLIEGGNSGQVAVWKLDQSELHTLFKGGVKEHADQPKSTQSQTSMPF